MELLAQEAPRYRMKKMMRRMLDLAPPNAMINAMLMTAPARSLAQRLYFHSRGSDQNFDEWHAAFERGELEPRSEQNNTPKLHLV